MCQAWLTGVTSLEEPGQVGFHPYCTGEAGIGEQRGELFKVTARQSCNSNANLHGNARLDFPEPLVS